MNSKTLLYLLLLTVSIVMVPSTIIQKVYADTDQFVYLTPLDEYWFRGQTAQFTVKSSEVNTQYTLRVYDPTEVLIHENNRTTDDNGTDQINLPISMSALSGTYTIQTDFSIGTAQCKRSVVEDTDFTATSFPFNRTHKDVNYTLVAKGFNAVSDSGNLTIQYPSLPVSFSVNSYSNNMTFVERLRNLGLGIRIDLSYMFIYQGLKIRINGTIPQPTTYTFSFVSPKTLLRKLSTLRSGGLVFDWADLQRTAQAFSYNYTTKKLTVNVPAQFDIDPYIFEDGFESGDFGAWTGTTTSGSSTIEVTESAKYFGDNGSRSYRNAWDSFSYCYIDLGSAYATVYARMYMKINSGGSSSDGAGGTFIQFTSSGNSRALFGIYNDGGTQRPAVRYWTGDWAFDVDGTFPDDWFCLDAIAGDTYVSLYIDDVLMVNITGITGLTKDSVRFGQIFEWGGGGLNTEIYMDGCVVDDDARIGTSGNTAPTIGEFHGPTIQYANTYDYVNCTVNDADLVADIENVTIQLNGSIQLLWVNSTDTFSEVSDASAYCTLDASGCVENSVNATALILSWKIKLTWTYTEGSIFCNGTVYDEDTSGSGGPTSVFTFEDDLEIDSTSHSPVEPEYGQSFSVTGTIHYSGTSTAPEDGSGITVRLVKAGFIVASTTTVTDSTGAFTITHTEDEPGDVSFDVYAITDEVTTLNQSERIIIVKGSWGPTGPGPTPPDDTNQPTDEDTGGTVPTGGAPTPTGIQISPVLIGAIIVIVIVGVTAYSQKPTLKKSRKAWKKDKDKKPKWKKEGNPFK